ncbi:DUF3322 domain-containing protein [Streptomyces chattanoogensis]|uniref:DUF3322 domain-containing protein n=1 Tax=Streptomyces chattanoogensis TaxID=66876 RepID=UPI0036BFF53D
MRDHSPQQVYLRETDLPGMDTKFVETHKAILAELLDHAPRGPHRRRCPEE